MTMGGGGSVVVGATVVVGAAVVVGASVSAGASVSGGASLAECLRAAFLAQPSTVPDDQHRVNSPPEFRVGRAVAGPVVSRRWDVSPARLR
jgi:hypothetical protein